MNAQHTRTETGGTVRRLPALLILAMMAALLAPAHLVRASEAWGTAPSLPQYAGSPAGTTAPCPSPNTSKSCIYAIGGYNAGLLTTVYSLAPGATAWDTTAPALPAGREFLSAATGKDGTIYAIGGRGLACTGGFCHSVSESTVYSYKPGTDTSWQTAPALPQPLDALAATTAPCPSPNTSKSCIYAIGGENGVDNPQSTVYSLAPGATAWDTTAPALPAALDVLTAATGKDGTIYAIGGESCIPYPTFTLCTPQSTVYSLAPGASAWQTMANGLPDARFELAAATGKDGSIYAIGGRDTNRTGQSTVYRLAPGAGAWNTLASSLPDARYGLAAATGSDGTLYAFGGNTDVSAPKAVYSLVPDTTSPTTTISLNPAKPNGKNTWYTSPVTVTVSATDPDDDASTLTTRCALDPATTPASFTDTQLGSCPSSVNTDGAHTLYAVSQDPAGNDEGTVQSAGFNIDQTPPTITCGTADTTWHQSNVTVSCQASDATSGLANTADASFTLSTSVAPGADTTTAMTGTHQVCDVAGNCATAGPIGPFQIDQTGPSITDQGASCSQPVTHGWCPGTETTTFAYSDATSGMAAPCTAPSGASCTQQVSSTGDGSAVTLSSSQAKDAAGNTTPAIAAGPFQIDATPPTITCGTADSVWHGNNVTVSCQASDATSGLADADDASFSLSTSVATGAETANAMTGSRTVCDVAGNCANATVGPFKIDLNAPSISCGSADGQWHATDVSIPCTASDAGSGLQNPADASFSLSTSVASGTETATASTGTHQVCDVAGNCVTAGPISGNLVDKQAPAISITSPTAGPYQLGQSITASYSCTDDGSGLGSCAAPVANSKTLTAGTPGTSTFTVRATDNAGNAASQSVTYAVRYGTKLLYTTPARGAVGGTVPIKLELTNAAGKNLSASSLTVQALCVVVKGATDCSGSPAIAYNPPQAFTYQSGLTAGGGYQFTVKTTGLTAGTPYQILFRVNGEDAGSYHADAAATFTLSAATARMTFDQLCTLTKQVVPAAGHPGAMCNALNGAKMAGADDTARTAFLSVYKRLVDAQIGHTITRAQATMLDGLADTLRPQ